MVTSPARQTPPGERPDREEGAARPAATSGLAVRGGGRPPSQTNDRPRQNPAYRPLPGVPFRASIHRRGAENRRGRGEVSTKCEERITAETQRSAEAAKNRARRTKNEARRTIHRRDAENRRGRKEPSTKNEERKRGREASEEESGTRENRPRHDQERRTRNALPTSRARPISCSCSCSTSGAMRAGRSGSCWRAAAGPAPWTSPRPPTFARRAASPPSGRGSPRS